MIERFIHFVRVEQPDPAEDATAARQRLRDVFPRPALRRMTHLGMLLGACIEGRGFGPEDAVVYASQFAETRALEDFLRSFPAASPLLFQTSIHPGGVQQVLIGRQQPVARLWPLAARERLVEQALSTALLESADRVWVLGGEERGAWLLEQGMASDRAFAFALELRAAREGAVGRVRCDPDSGPDEFPPDLWRFTRALAERTELRWRGMGWRWELHWL